MNIIGFETNVEFIVIIISQRRKDFCTHFQFHPVFP